MREYEQEGGCRHGVYLGEGVTVGVALAWE